MHLLVSLSLWSPLVLVAMASFANEMLKVRIERERCREVGKRERERDVQ